MRARHSEFPQRIQANGEIVLREVQRPGSGASSERRELGGSQNGSLSTRYLMHEAHPCPHPAYQNSTGVLLTPATARERASLRLVDPLEDITPTHPPFPSPRPVFTTPFSQISDLFHTDFSQHC